MTSETHSRLISVSGRSYRATPTMCDIFLAHVSDITARREMQLVPLLHDGGVDMILIGETTRISVANIEAVPTIAVPTAAATTGVSAA